MKKERAKRSVVWKGCSDSEFIELVKASNTFSAILNFFGLDHKGGNCKTVKARIQKLGINSDHIPDGVSCNIGRKFYKEKIPLKDIFIEKSNYNRRDLKKRIIEENLIEKKCSKCGIIDTWNNKPIVLILDHINGINNDNRIENLRFLCPNCNSQTPTFAGRNVKTKAEKFYCPVCGSEKLKSSKVCSLCVGSTRRKIKARPTKEQLEKEISESSMVAIGKKYGVSDNAIRKWAKGYGIIV